MELTKNAPAASTSPLNAIVTMFYEPTSTFQQLEARPRAWIPLLLLIVSMVALMFWYFAAVDFAWLSDQVVAGMKTAEEREQAAKFMSKSVMQMSTIGGTVVAFPLMFAIMGAYLMLVSKSMSNGLSFGKGFALAVWSSVPSLLLLPLGAMQIMLSSSGQLGFSDLNPLSLNQLLFHYEVTHPLAGIMDSLNLTTFWSIFLTVIGYEVWAKASRATALKVVLIPYVTIYGLWIAYAMSQAA